MSVGDQKYRSSGFTLVELLVTIALIAVFATIAVPSYQDLAARSRLSGDFNQILSAVNYARSEAIKRRENVTAKVVKNSWKVVVEDSESASLRVVESSDDRVSVAPENFSVTFNPLGRRSPTSACGASCELTVSHHGDKSLSVNVSGNISRP
ncbi:GspH/FimT family pseudopilin [Halomonas getboli]|uniref:GspH/FimT family pseudopilin n=1 Tax=Halomonas getboli TaxID=2935862 RepID=UPI001FFE810B|nr:GspH/FimT family pseudopilin [Halomonas getboli]MCK2185424.1 GspH/FimT family pseudopilin [Halomonas getboli]